MSWCDLWCGAWCGCWLWGGACSGLWHSCRGWWGFLGCGVVVALWVTLLSKHEVCLCILLTSSSWSFTSGVSPRRSRQWSPSVSQISIHSSLSGWCQSMLVSQCQRLNVRDSIPETQCQRLNARDSMSEWDLLTWSCVFGIPRTSVYNMILVYEGIVQLAWLVSIPELLQGHQWMETGNSQHLGPGSSTLS